MDDFSAIRERHTLQNGIEMIRDCGFSVQRLTEYHYRIESVLDLYPTRGRFHHLKTGEKGSYNNRNLFGWFRAYAQRQGIQPAMAAGSLT